MQAWSKVLSFTDPLSYQLAIVDRDLEVLPAARGDFRAELTQISLNKLFVQRAHESLPVVSVGTVHPGRRLIGFLADPNQPAIFYGGIEVSAGDIIVNISDAIHRRTKTACDWWAMSLASADFDAAYKSVTGHELPAATPIHLVRPRPALMSRLLEALANVEFTARTNPDVFATPELAKALEAQLTHLLIRCLTDGTSIERSAGCLRRDRVVARFEEYLEENQGRSLHLAEICGAIGTAERTLRGACEEHLGMGPIRFLTLRRMHLARRALLRSDPADTSVTRIATEHGFWELGHFAVAYRELFGETPSTSLRLPPSRGKFASRRSSLVSA